MKRLLDVHVILGVVALAIASFSWRLWAQARSDHKDRVELYDSNDQVRVRMVATDAGGRIELVDDQGRVRLVLRQDGDTTALELKREGSGGKGIEMIVHDGVDAAASPATVSVYSKTGSDVATLGATDRAWLSLRSGQNELAVRQAAEQSEIAITHGTQAVRYQLENDRSRFVSDVPIYIRPSVPQKLDFGGWLLEEPSPK